MFDILDTNIKGSGNAIVLTIHGFDLNTADDIELVYGSETYTLLNNPEVINVVSSEELSLSLGGTSETSSPFLVIKVFTGTYPRPEGFTLTNKCLGNLARPSICQ